MFQGRTWENKRQYFAQNINLLRFIFTQTKNYYRYASKIRKRKSCRVSEHKDRNESRKASGSGSCDFFEESRNVQQTSHEVRSYGKAHEEEMKKPAGLYANLHAKRERIAAGSGEKMRKPGEKGAPTAAAFKAAAKTAKKK
jgi:hypothetical protein